MALSHSGQGAAARPLGQACSFDAARFQRRRAAESLIDIRLFYADSCLRPSRALRARRQEGGCWRALGRHAAASAIFCHTLG